MKFMYTMQSVDESNPPTRMVFHIHNMRVLYYQLSTLMDVAWISLLIKHMFIKPHGGTPNHPLEEENRPKPLWLRCPRIKHKPHMPWVQLTLLKPPAPLDFHRRSIEPADPRTQQAALPDPLQR